MCMVLALMVRGRLSGAGSHPLCSRSALGRGTAIGPAWLPVSIQSVISLPLLQVIFKILTIKNALVGFGNSGLMTVVSELPAAAACLLALPSCRRCRSCTAPATRRAYWPPYCCYPSP